MGQLEYSAAYNCRSFYEITSIEDHNRLADILANCRPFTRPSNKKIEKRTFKNKQKKHPSELYVKHTSLLMVKMGYTLSPKVVIKIVQNMYRNIKNALAYSDGSRLNRQSSSDPQQTAIDDLGGSGGNGVVQAGGFE